MPQISRVGWIDQCFGHVFRLLRDLCPFFPIGGSSNGTKYGDLALVSPPWRRSNGLPETCWHALTNSCRSRESRSLLWRAAGWSVLFPCGAQIVCSKLLESIGIACAQTSYMKWPTGVIWWVYIYNYHLSQWIPLWSIDFDDKPSMFTLQYTHHCHRPPGLVGYILAVCCLNLHFHAPCSSFGRWKISTCLGEHQVPIKSCTSITHIQIYFFLLK